MMKFLMIVLLLSPLQQTSACPGVDHAQWNYSIDLASWDQSEREFEIWAEEYRWLYEELMPETTRNQSPDEAWKSFRVHLKDSYKKFPELARITKKNLIPFAGSTELEGKITYVGFVKKSYRMTLMTVRDELNLIVRVHLAGARGDDLKNFSEKMKVAEDLWNQYRIPTDFKYRFKFEIAPTAELAHFSVQVVDDTRGPYDTYWGRNWTGNVIAHEIGHMLGLADEYKTISGEFDCLRGSLMCSAWYGYHMKHHYYFILRRLIRDQ